jgi:lysophospholipase L1-like esterase
MKPPPRPTPLPSLTLAASLLLALTLGPARPLPSHAAEPDPASSLSSLTSARRIVCLGDSITYAGEYLEFFETWLRLSHPASRFELLNLGLPSETVSGLSEDGHAGGAFPRPDLHERLDRVLQQTQPDVVLACYGMNDGIYFPYAESRAARFHDGIRRLRTKTAAANARIIHLTPAPFDPIPLAGRTLPAGRDLYPQPYEGYDNVLTEFSNWLVNQRTNHWSVIDIHQPVAAFLANRRRSQPDFLLAGDGVHPTRLGHWLIARELIRHFAPPHTTNASQADDPDAWLASHPQAHDVLRLVQKRQRLLKDAWLTRTGHQRPGMNPGKPFDDASREAAAIDADLHRILDQPPAPNLPGTRSDWHGFPRYDFEIGGRPVLVVTPNQPAPGLPWVWHGEFFGHKPAPDIALLHRGVHVVYTSIPDHLGGPQAVAHWNVVHHELTSRHGFSPKPGLVGLSRGGLYCYNWAIANPSKVACIYGDAPVCDFKSWPGGKGSGPGSAVDWQRVIERYGFRNEAEALAFPGNPVDNLAPLATAGVPILHVFGDADEVVPWEENTGLVATRYKALGGPITLIRKPGVKHHPHGLDDPSPIIDFLWTHTANDQAKAWLAQRPSHP